MLVKPTIFLQDYARLHNYKVTTPCQLADPSLTSMWNKIGWILKAMKVKPYPAVGKYQVFA